jgi:hypothetical protein
MSIIVTYDVPNRHVELKKVLFGKGYQDFILRFFNGTLRKVYLPNTTVYHASKDAQSGVDDVSAACVSLRIEIERCVSTQWGPDCAAIWGKPFGT